jgi:PTH1 family peptidyl-tRNA hydrolase
MFRKKPVEPSTPPVWMLVGLGNPGPEYKGTRHNVGFEFIDLLAEQQGIKLSTATHQARYGIGTVADVSVLLVKPLTFMNLSGRSVAPLAREYGLTPEKICVVADDLDLEVGRVRLKPKGSAGGHNGHKSLIASLQSSEYPRLKIGIGSVDRSQTVDYVLGRFNPDERSRIESAFGRCRLAVEALVTRGLEAALNVANEPGT